MEGFKSKNKGEKMNVIEEIRNEADAQRTAESLRDSGYSLNTSVADLVDNSIEARANKIMIIFDLDFEGNVIFSLADNGKGMDREGLCNAMKYGADERKDRTEGFSLGKFGMGLKTASTAQARIVKLISRPKKGEDTLGISLDLDNYEGWKNTLFLPNEEELELLSEVCKEESGTLVTWEEIDRVLLKSSGNAYTDPMGEYAQKNIQAQKKHLEHHLNLVFYRFIQPYKEHPKRVDIVLNGKSLEGWNPFRPNIVSKPNQEEVLEVEHSNGTSEISVSAYQMPHQNHIEDDEERKLALINQENQGFYVFREDRLLMLPEYFGIRKRDEHYKLFRAEINFKPDLDIAFQVDFKKSRIVIEEQIKEALKECTDATFREAQAAYRSGKKDKIVEDSKDIHDSSNRGISDKVDTVETARINDVDRSGLADIDNEEGNQKGIEIVGVSVSKPGQVHVQPSDDVKNDCLWEPAAIEKDGKHHNAVRINTNHPFYEKLYWKYKDSGILIEALDSLLWSLAQAELRVVNPQIQKKLKDYRHSASSILEDCIEDLPGVSDSELE